MENTDISDMGQRKMTEEITRDLLIVELTKNSKFPGFATAGGPVNRSGIIYISHPMSMRKLFHAWRTIRRIRKENKC